MEFWAKSSVSMKAESLQNKLQVKFKNSRLLRQALTHRSYLNEHPSCPEGSNERMEFLGDAVLEFLVTKFLFLNYRQSSEGELTCFRSGAVSEKSLSGVAQELNLGHYLKLAKGEAESGGREKPSILADTFEAILGALFLDQGLDEVEKFLNRTLFTKTSKMIAKGAYRDPKHKIAPRYEVLAESGPDHQKHFTIGVFVNNKMIGKGEGPSKQDAEVKAASVALEKYDKMGH
jgi:ribonuclease-3